MRLFQAIHILRPKMVKVSDFGALQVRENTIVIPELSPSVVTRIEQLGFSVEGFLRGRQQGLNFLEARELEAFLDKVMGGIDAILTREPKQRLR
jgi:hypothetical protein